MSRLPLEQMIASLRPEAASEPKLGTIAGEASVLVMVLLPLLVVGQTQPCGLGRPETYAIFFAGFCGNRTNSVLIGMPPTVDTRRRVGVSPTSSKSLRRKRIAFQCSSVSAMPICSASAVPSASSHSLGSVRKPSSLTWISWPLRVVTGIALSPSYLVVLAVFVVVLPTMDMWVGTGIEWPGSRTLQ